jgi:hypothetical protein
VADHARREELTAPLWASTSRSEKPILFLDRLLLTHYHGSFSQDFVVSQITGPTYSLIRTLACQAA